MSPEADYRTLSFWHESAGEALAPRASLDGDDEVDVAIVGGGYSGLWTAYYLSRLEPSLRIAILEAEISGFGASGRNGGWATGALSGIEGLLARPERRAAGLALQREVFAAVDEIGAVAIRESIDCDYRKGGSLHVARNDRQRASVRELVERARAWGLGADDYRWLEPEECERHAHIADCLGGVFTPHCASLHPAKLVRGLARVVEARGVRIHDRSPVRRIEAGAAHTDRARLRARVVVRATEAYTNSLEGHARNLVPLHSLMIATAPLPDELWKQIGLEHGQTFGDDRRIVIYGQRTACGRIAFGGRAGYRLGSGVESRFAADDPRFERVHEALLELFPGLLGTPITHRWGGALGVPRDWAPSVGIERKTGLAWLGGYVGQGVAASNAAGRTLAELILERDTERTRLPWVGHESRRWEPEPLRWLAVRGITGFADAADRAEQRGGRARIRERLFDAFVGR